MLGCTSTHDSYSWFWFWNNSSAVLWLSYFRLPGCKGIETSQKLWEKKKKKKSVFNTRPLVFYVYSFLTEKKAKRIIWLLYYIFWIQIDCGLLKCKFNKPVLRYTHFTLQLLLMLTIYAVNSMKMKKENWVMFSHDIWTEFWLLLSWKNIFS